MSAIRYGLSVLASPIGWKAFARTLVSGARVLDAGCGNNSPFKLKSQRPDIHYIGLDIGDSNETAPILADQYILTTPEGFAPAIEALDGCLDAVISSP